jgi:hypothetical protein
LSQGGTTRKERSWKAFESIYEFEDKNVLDAKPISIFSYFNVVFYASYENVEINKNEKN